MAVVETIEYETKGINSYHQEVTIDEEKHKDFYSKIESVIRINIGALLNKVDRLMEREGKDPENGFQMVDGFLQDLNKIKLPIPGNPGTIKVYVNFLSETGDLIAKTGFPLEFAEQSFKDEVLAILDSIPATPIQ